MLLAAYPSADVALTNRGGFRQSIPAGEITLATIVGVLPLNNVLIDVELTGAQLIENIACCQPVIDWITSLNTSPDDLLDAYLDTVRRQR